MSEGEINWRFDADLPSPPPDSTPTEGGPPASVQLSKGSAFDVYQVLEVLGRGAQGVVYRARDRRTGRDVALKLMSCALTGRQRERFRREGELTASLVHSGIVKVHAAGEAAGVPYLAYELVEGCRTLTDLFESDRETLLRLVRDAADAIGYAHRSGVVHRDVKPDNLLIDQRGRVHVADFGLARGVDMQSLTRTGDVLGTPWYMAPEQFEGERAAVGPPADVWALGVVLYRCLTGTQPFDGPSMLELMSQVMSKSIAPRRLDPSISRDLEAICLRALQRDPAERYPDAKALAEDLSLVLEGRSPLGAARPRRPWPAVAGLVLVLTLAGVSALALRGDEGTPEPVRPTPGAAPHGTQVSGAELRRLLEDGLREAALARQAEDPRYWRSEEASATPAARRARAQAALSQALELAAPGSSEERRARLGLARLGGSSQREALLESLRASGDPEALLLLAEGELSHARPQDALRTLDGLPEGLRAGARGQLARGEVLLELGEVQAAFECAQASALSDDSDLGSFPALRDLLQGLSQAPLSAEELRSVGLLLGVSDADTTAAILAQVEKEKVRSFPPPDARRATDRLLKASPYSWELRYLRGRGSFTLGQTRAGVWDWILACSRCPRLLGWLRFDLKQLSYMQSVLGKKDTIGELVAGSPEDTPRGRLTRAILMALQAEFEGGLGFGEVRAALDACLDETPGSILLHLVRAFVHVRLDALDEAERDMALVEEVFPDSAQLAFFRALLLARRRAPLKPVAEQIRRAEQLGCKEWRRVDHWDPDAYPEMGRYRGAPELTLFFQRHN